METEADLRGTSIVGRLGRLSEFATAGFAVPLHFRYQTPTYMFQTYPSAWIETYSREGLMLVDPVVRWALGHEGATTWAELERDDPGGVMARAKAFGLAHGIVVGVAREGGRSMASLARGDRPLSADETAETLDLLEALHDATAGAVPLSAPTRAELRRMSIAFTHPGPGRPAPSR